jgi:hypothetical protein
MPRLIEICLEDLDLPADERYLRCVALPGGEPGLTLDGQGAVRWMSDDPTHCGLWVSGDDRLALVRGAVAAPVVVHRAGRALEAPVGKPVILLDGDLLQVEHRQLRVHVHGATEVIHGPELPRRNHDGLLQRLQRCGQVRLVLPEQPSRGQDWLVQHQRQLDDAPGESEATQRLGPVRHGGPRLGVVP